ncbi:nuclear cap binding complex subunit [Ciborinia camelliae]|nr:nuclear cap binding complex subunit [Ciborinia camelliae]
MLQEARPDISSVNGTLLGLTHGTKDRFALREKLKMTKSMKNDYARFTMMQKSADYHDALSRPNTISQLIMDLWSFGNCQRSMSVSSEQILMLNFRRQIYGRGNSGGQVRDEHREEYDEGRGGLGRAIQAEDMKKKKSLRDEYRRCALLHSISTYQEN